MTAPSAGLLGSRFALFADCLIVGLFTAVAALPVVTAYPALVAACAVLRERVAEDRTAGLRAYTRRLHDAIHSGPAGLVVPPLVAALIGLDALAVAAGVPGARPLGALLAVATVAALAVGLRAAAGWRPGAPWPAVARAAVQATVRDPGGSALLALAGTCAAAIALIVPVTALLIAGPLALATVAISGRS